MKKAMLGLALTVTSCLMTGSFAMPVRAADVVRVMPLGASITQGIASSDGNGYRERLRQLLENYAGVDIDYAGSKRDGAMTDNDNEGHPGYRIDQVAAGTDGWLAAARPDVVLLNAGTNDVWQNYDLPHAPSRLQALIEKIASDLPNATIIFSTLVPAGDPAHKQGVRDFNAALPAIARAEQAAGRKVSLVDMYANLTDADIGSDTVHPTDAGYRKMGNAWYAALRPALGTGRPWPAYRNDLGVNAQQLTWTNSVVGSVNVGGYCCGLPGMESGNREEIAQGPTHALMYSGTDNSAGQSYSYNQLFDVHVPIDSDAVLTYWIYPQQTNGTFVALDLLLTDGRSLRDSGAVDQYGTRAHPLYQGQGQHLVVNQWNRISVRLAPLAGGIIDRIHVGYDQPASTGQFRGYIDTIDITSG